MFDDDRRKQHLTLSTSVVMLDESLGFAHFLMLCLALYAYGCLATKHHSRSTTLVRRSSWKFETHLMFFFIVAWRAPYVYSVSTNISRVDHMGEWRCCDVLVKCVNPMQSIVLPLLLTCLMENLLCAEQESPLASDHRQYRQNVSSRRTIFQNEVSRRLRDERCFCFVCLQKHTMTIEYIRSHTYVDSICNLNKERFVDGKQSVSFLFYW